jgi:AcrR family transcriptional regulator
MPRTQQFDADLLLDAARTLAVEAGPGAVSMAAVARSAGAPSGSLYHRFPSRAVLLGELWLRCLTRFHAAYLCCLTADDPQAAAIAAARQVVDWCRANPEDAALLSHSRREFAVGDWPSELTTRAEQANREVFIALRKLISRLEMDKERVMVAVVDLPYAVVRRHLGAGNTIPAGATDVVESAVRALL